jgi:hypothetical protein
MEQVGVGEPAAVVDGAGAVDDPAGGAPAGGEPAGDEPAGDEAEGGQE